jgi:hypothetical protein
MPKLILHIGLPKTGTTFLQEWLELNCHALAGAGILTLSSQTAHRLAIEGLHEPSLIGRRDVASIRSACSMTSVRNEIRREPGARIVVSSEYFHVGSPDYLASFLRSEDVQVEAVICYLRRQDLLCASGYAQAVKSLGLAREHDDRPLLYTELLDWNVLHKRWTSVFPEADMIFVNYDKAKPDLVGSFSRAIGSQQVETKLPDQRPNPSFSAEMTEVARLLNLRGKSFDPDKMLQLQSKYPFVPFGFSRPITAGFEALFRPSNAAFAAMFGDEFSDYAAPGWEPIGEDLTGQLTVERLIDLFHAVLTS